MLSRSGLLIIKISLGTVHLDNIFATDIICISILKISQLLFIFTTIMQMTKALISLI